MHITKRRVRSLTLRALLYSALWGLAATALAAPEAAVSPHRIGVIYGLSGPAQVWGTYGRMGLELARDEINAAGGVAGRPLELVVEDSQTKATSAVAAYRKLVTINKVPIVIGDVWDFLTNPLIPLASRDGTLLLTPTTTPSALQGSGAGVFTLGHDANTIKESVYAFFRLNPHVRRVGILCWDDPWGATYLNAWREALKGSGATEVVAVCTSDFSTDFRTEVLKVASKGVDAIFIAHLADVALKRIREQSLKVSILTTSNVVEDLKIKHAPQELFEGSSSRTGSLTLTLSRNLLLSLERNRSLTRTTAMSRCVPLHKHWRRIRPTLPLPCEPSSIQGWLAR